MSELTEAPIMDRPKEAAHPAPAPEQRAEDDRRHSHWWLWFLALGLAAWAVYSSVHHFTASRDARQTSAESAIPFVIVGQPKMAQPDYDLTLPGNVEPYSNTPIYARTDGYLKRWLVDIGAPVKQGQLLAEIESPEVDQQLNEAIGSLQQAEANFKLAQVTAARWQEMLTKNTVSRQDADQKQSDLEAAKANDVAANANVARLRQLKGFEQVAAPFDGVVTQRNVEVGDLISSTMNAGEKPLFQVADDHVLRIYINVPETQAGEITIGQPAKLSLSSRPGETIPGKVVRTASAIDPQSRTLLTEIQVDNSERKLLAGGYAIVHLPIHLEKPSLILPVNALLFRPEGTQAGIVSADGTVTLKTLKIGKDFGTTVEVIDGLKADDQVIINPSDSLQNGDRVKVQSPKDHGSSK